MDNDLFSNLRKCRFRSARRPKSCFIPYQADAIGSPRHFPKGGHQSVTKPCQLEIERLDKMTVLQDFDMRRSSRSDTLHEHIPDALPCFLHVFTAIADIPLRYRETCLICCTKMEARTQWRRRERQGAEELSGLSFISDRVIHIDWL